MKAQDSCAPWCAERGDGCYTCKVAGYVTVADAATMLGVTRARVAQLIAAKRIPAVRIGAGPRGKMLLRATDVLTFERLPLGRPRRRPRGGS